MVGRWLEETSSCSSKEQFAFASYRLTMTRHWGGVDHVSPRSNRIHRSSALSAEVSPIRKDVSNVKVWDVWYVNSEFGTFHMVAKCPKLLQWPKLWDIWNALSYRRDLWKERGQETTVQWSSLLSMWRIERDGYNNVLQITSVTVTLVLPIPTGGDWQKFLYNQMSQYQMIFSVQRSFLGTKKLSI